MLGAENPAVGATRKNLAESLEMQVILAKRLHINKDMGLNVYMSNTTSFFLRSSNHCCVAGPVWDHGGLIRLWITNEEAIFLFFSVRNKFQSFQHQQQMIHKPGLDIFDGNLCRRQNKFRSRDDDQNTA